MNFFDLVNIAEENVTILNPMEREKFIKLGEILKLSSEKTVLDLACGFGEVLAIWGSTFNTSGTGVEIREYACKKARERLSNLRIEGVNIECENATEYKPTSPYDCVAVIGASFIYSGFRGSLKMMKSMLKEGGKLVIGEPYLIKEPTTDDAKAFIRDEGVYREFELLEMIHEEGLELEYLIRSNRDEWDSYKTQNWQGLNKWLEEHRGHPEWDVVHQYMRKNQEEYMKFGREYMGWAVYVLKEQ